MLIETKMFYSDALSDPSLMKIVSVATKRSKKFVLRSCAAEVVSAAKIQSDVVRLGCMSHHESYLLDLCLASSYFDV